MTAWLLRSIQLAIFVVSLFCSSTRLHAQTTEGDFRTGLVYRFVSALQVGDLSTLASLLTPESAQALAAFTQGTGRDASLAQLGPIERVSTPTTEGVDDTIRYRATVWHPRGFVRWGLEVGASDHRIRKWWRTNLVSAYHSGRGLGEVASNQLWGPPPDWLLTRSATTTTVDPGPLDPRVVEFLFVTTRKKTGQSSNIGFSHERASNVSFGVASVRVPEDHKIGRLELPAKWQVLGISLRDEPSQQHKHFTLRGVVELTAEKWDEIVTSKRANTALIFVHGFNNSFEAALYRNAQIVWDLQYRGLSILFSWASAGDPTGYLYDRDSAYGARSAFIDLLKVLKEKHRIEHVNVLAHSMGNLVVLDALSNYAKTENPVQIRELIMAAPDVDQDQFPAMIKDIGKVVRGKTLYASSSDKALVLSRALARRPRAGDVFQGEPLVLPDLDTIDVTAIGEEMFGLNHNTFATYRGLISDIAILLETGAHPPGDRRLSEIRPVPEHPLQPRYWRYVR